MEALRNSFSSRTIFIPILMIASLLLVLRGMRTPDLSNLQKPRALHRAVLYNQIKEAKVGIEDYDRFFDLSHHTTLIEPRLFQASSFICLTYLCNSYSNVFPVASRAPPVFHAWNLRLVLDCNIVDIVAQYGELHFFVRCSRMPSLFEWSWNRRFCLYPYLLQSGGSMTRVRKLEVSTELSN